MKKSNLKRASLIFGSALMISVVFTSCKNDDSDPAPNPGEEIVDSKNLDYSAENANSWHNYSVRVAELLTRDSEELYNAWNTSYEGGDSYANIFRSANSSVYPSCLSCIDEIIDGCRDIAGEVGDAKIGDPYDLYIQGKREEALYAVESWYSWHSRDDYANNILSIRNSYYGSLDGSINPNSMSALVSSLDEDLDNTTKTLIENARKAIVAIPQPFRNHINSMEALGAQTACGELEKHLENTLKAFFQNLPTSYDSQLKGIVENYVDNVVLPTYSMLKERNASLLEAVKDLASLRSNAAFEKACEAWLSAREPWEESEAFLFGPVDAMGLDPNMDSWPLDQDAIVNHLKSGNFDDLNWGNGDDDDKIEAAQNIRGFHTLEFLLFKDGQPRKVN